MNTKQRESVAKYLYDISKGALLAGVVSYLASKVSVLIFVVHVAVAIYAFMTAFYLEDEG